MKQATVIVPFAGALQVFLDAEEGETDSDLIDRAMELAQVNIAPFDANVCDVLEWDTYRKTGEGNVTYLAYREASVEYD